MSLALNFILGVVCGLCREFLVIKYYQAIQSKGRLLGSAISLAMGILDLFVMANLALAGNVSVAVGYVIGETLGTYFGIGAKNV